MTAGYRAVIRLRQSEHPKSRQVAYRRVATSGDGRSRPDGVAPELNRTKNRSPDPDTFHTFCSSFRSIQYARSSASDSLSQRPCPRHSSNSIATSCSSSPAVVTETSSPPLVMVHREATPEATSAGSEIRQGPNRRAMEQGKARTGGRMNSRTSAADRLGPRTKVHPCASRSGLRVGPWHLRSAASPHVAKRFEAPFPFRHG